MTAVSPAVSPSVSTSVSASSTAVNVDKEPQRTARTAPKDATRVPYVPNSGDVIPAETPAQPKMGNAVSVSRTPGNPAKGSPTVPGMNGVLFRRGPIDAHYTDEYELSNPYARVNNPATQGRQSWVKAFANHVFNGKQNVDQAGWQQNTPQQRTSYMRVDSTRSGGYAPERYDVRIQPQTARTASPRNVLGSDAYGSTSGSMARGVLNRDTYGAGQTAGGLGGNNYTAAPGSPDTNQVQPTDAGMPVWG